MKSGKRKKAARIGLTLISTAFAAGAGLCAFLMLTAYSPADIEPLTVNEIAHQVPLQTESLITAVTWNIGYAGLGKDQNFFMDGGTMVRPNRKEVVAENISGIMDTLSQQQADIYLLQEVDENSHRTYHINQRDLFGGGMLMNTAFALNIHCNFVPYPWPPIGKVKSGLMTLSRFQTLEATRESLPVSFSWPISAVNFKRCMLIEKLPVVGTDKMLVLINVHFDAYDDGEGRRAQTDHLMKTLQEAYQNGDYVIVGGDFNQIFPDAAHYPVLDATYWAPGQLSADDLPEGFRYAFDDATPTCRLLNENYSGNREQTQLYVIDGYILSSNIRVESIQTVDEDFRYSDHNPVRLTFEMLAAKM